MDPTDHTLLQLLRRLFWAEQQIDHLREQNRQLQAAYTDLKNEMEAQHADSPGVH